jgi:hypothetical protein
MMDTKGYLEDVVALTGANLISTEMGHIIE